MFNIARGGFNYDQLIEPVRIPMTIFFYNFDWVWNYELWQQSHMVNIECLKNIKSFSIIRNNITVNKKITLVLGWHLRYFLEPKDLVEIQLKISKTNNDKTSYKEDLLHFIKECIKNGLNFLDPEKKFLPSNIFESEIIYPDFWNVLNKDLKALQI